MSLTQISKTDPDEFSRYEERKTMTDYRKSLRSNRITDAVLKEYIYHAFWKDHVLREIEYYEIDVHVKNGTVYLHGHIVDASTKSRIENAIQAIPGINGIKNELVIDDSLSAELAESLGKLEHIYCCKFYTRVSHGVVSLNGLVSSENLKCSRMRSGLQSRCPVLPANPASWSTRPSRLCVHRPIPPG